MGMGRSWGGHENCMGPTCNDVMYISRKNAEYLFDESYL